jgi:hypothetical protein
MAPKKRNYREEYDKYHKTKEQKKRRAARNKARRAALAKGTVKKGDTLDVHHRDSNPRNNSGRNVAVVSRKKNRGALRVKGLA